MRSRYKHIPIEVLRAFVIISETGSFTKAANELNLSQSAVSLQIKRLQQIVGSDVFAKSPLGHSLTDWPAPGSEDTELGVLMEPEVGHGETEVYTRVQA